MERAGLLVLLPPARHPGLGGRLRPLAPPLRLRVAPLALVDRVGRGGAGSPSVLVALRSLAQRGGGGLQARLPCRGRRPPGRRPGCRPGASGRRPGRRRGRRPAPPRRRRRPRSRAMTSTPGCACSQAARLSLERSGKQIDGAVALEVDEDRAVGQPLVDRPVVDAEHRRRRPLGLGGAADEPQQGVGADRHPVLGRQARARLARRGRRRGRVSALALAVGPAGAGRGDPRQPFGEDPRAGRSGCRRRTSGPGRCRRTANRAHGRSASVRVVAAVDAVGRFAAERAARRRWPRRRRGSSPRRRRAGAPRRGATAGSGTRRGRPWGTSAGAGSRTAALSPSHAGRGPLHLRGRAPMSWRGLFFNGLRDDGYQATLGSGEKFATSSACAMGMSWPAASFQILAREAFPRAMSPSPRPCRKRRPPGGGWVLTRRVPWSTPRQRMLALPQFW